MSAKVLVGDCRMVMRRLAKDGARFDAIVTDPPYGISFQSTMRTEKVARHSKIANDERPYVWFLPDAYNLLAEDGALVCFCRWDTQEAFRLAIEWAGFKVRSQVIWDREWHGMGDLKASFAPRHDVLWFATKGRYRFPGARPHSVVRSKRICGEQLVHPNEKPLDLMRQLVRAVVPEGGSVLDPFAGSGATLAAAKAEGRKAVGIELSHAYATLIKQRLAA